MSRDEDTGRFESEYTDEAILDAVQEISGPVTTGEVSEKMGCDRATAYRRLDALTEKGDLQHMKKGNTNLWMLAGESDVLN